MEIKKCKCKQCSSENKDNYRPAYQNNNKENLKHGYFCMFCDMPYYNCLCSHDKL